MGWGVGWGVGCVGWGVWVVGVEAGGGGSFNPLSEIVLKGESIILLQFSLRINIIKHVISDLTQTNKQINK